MRVLFIRHAAAEDKGSFGGNDMLRPLTEEGRAKAQAAFKTLARIYPAIDMIVSSEAVRARETAKILSQCFNDAKIEENLLFNPGSDFAGFRKLIGTLWGKYETVALVGHEPDFSTILASVVSEGILRIDVKKASCIEVDVNRIGKGEIKALLPPSVIISAKR